MSLIHPSVISRQQQLTHNPNNSTNGQYLSQCNIDLLVPPLILYYFVAHRESQNKLIIGEWSSLCVGVELIGAIVAIIRQQGGQWEYRLVRVYIYLVYWVGYYWRLVHSVLVAVENVVRECDVLVCAVKGVHDCVGECYMDLVLARWLYALGRY